MKFKPGDLVWVSNIEGMRGELPGVVKSHACMEPIANKALTFRIKAPWYSIDLPLPGENWVSSEGCLRPRRDDYQQHEGKSSKQKCLDILNGKIVVPTVAA